MSTLLKKSLQDVTRRKLRAFLTIFGILLGVLGLTALNTASNQVSNSFSYTSNAASLPDLQLTTTSAPANLDALLQQQPNVQLASAQNSINTRWAIPSGHYSLNIVGIKDFQNVQFNTFQLLSGHFPGPNEILLESNDGQVTPLQVGERITILMNGQNQQLTISGFARTQGLPSPLLTSVARGYMGENTLESLFRLNGVNQFLLRLKDKSSKASQATAQQLISVLSARQVTTLNASIKPALASNSTKTDTLLVIIGSISIIALLLSVVLLISTISTLVREQFPIIGTMKALGAQQYQIMLNYLTTVAIYALIGTVLGILLGVLGGYLLTNLFSSVLNLENGPLSLAPATLIISLVVGLGTPLLAAIVPIAIGTRITVHQALSGYGLEQSNARLSRTSNITTFLPQTMQLGLRSLARRKSRTLLTLMGLAASGIVFLAVLSGIASLSATINQLVNTYHFDTWITLQQPLSYNQLQQTLASVSGISRMEPETNADIETNWGPGTLEGLEADTQVYQKQIVAGRWFRANEQGVVVINQHMAELSGLSVGDTLSLHNELSSANWRVIGIVQDSNAISPGMVGVMLTSLTQVNAFNHQAPDMTNQLFIQASDTSNTGVDALATHIDNALSQHNIQETIQTVQQFTIATYDEESLIATLLFVAVAIVALVGAMNLFNTLAMSILERQREIGILRSMGARNTKVIAVFWTEGTALGLLAWLCALLLGIPAAYGFVQFLSALLTPLPFTFNPLSMLYMLIFMLIIAALASIFPALSASHVKIAQTLRYE